MATRSVATVFGGSGFIGRYVVKRLAQAGHVVRVASRNPDRAGLLRPMGVVGQIVPLYASLSNAADVARAVQGSDFVVNLIGVLSEARAGDFKRLQEDGAGRLPTAAGGRRRGPGGGGGAGGAPPAPGRRRAAPAPPPRRAPRAGVRRMVQVSAIGADPASPSRYAQTKAAGEQTVRAAMPAATVLRPSLVFGPEDQFFNRFAAMTRFSPVMPVIAGDTRFQPVYVCDVADAIMAGLARDDAAGRTFELGGPRVWTFRELLAWIVAQTHRRRPLVEVPLGVARLQARVLEKLPGRLLTQDQLLQLTRDNVVAAGASGLAELGIAATPVELVVPGYLARFRPGGTRRQQLA